MVGERSEVRLQICVGEVIARRRLAVKAGHKHNLAATVRKRVEAWTEWGDGIEGVSLLMVRVQGQGVQEVGLGHDQQAYAVERVSAHIRPCKLLRAIAGAYAKDGQCPCAFCLYCFFLRCVFA